jgi:hypothetical protein
MQADEDTIPVTHPSSPHIRFTSLLGLSLFQLSCSDITKRLNGITLTPALFIFPPELPELKLPLPHNKLP